MTYTIYQIKIGNYKFVGITSRTLTQRMKDHYRDSKSVSGCSITTKLCTKKDELNELYTRMKRADKKNIHASVLKKLNNKTYSEAMQIRNKYR